VCSVLLSVATPSVLLAQGRITNAKTETLSATQGVERAVRSVAARGGVAWVGYRLPMIAGPRQMCCFDTIRDANDTCCGMCRLEGGGGVSMSTGTTASRGGRVVLESPAEFLVLARLENGGVTRIRTFTPDCDIDAGGLPVVWLTDVKAPESVAWLLGLLSSPASAGREKEERVLTTAVAALALHDTPQALPALIGLAKNDASRRVRGQALFWLAQRAGEQALATIAGVVDSDPDTELKKKAVFALSQMPKDEGVPKLIELARSHRNREVRKQAMFWLGQSNDPRAVQFFEEILLKK
jgi:hypothetical protein